MTDGTPDREALDTAQDLTAALGKMAAEVKRLRTYGRHNRKFIFFDIALTVLLTVFGYLSVHAVNQASGARQIAAAEHANLVAACRAGNQTRAEQVTLWTHLAQVSTPPPRATKAQRAKDRQKIAALLRYIHKTFAAKDCAAVYATSGPGR